MGIKNHDRLHEYGYGRKLVIKKNNGQEEYWINQDLIVSDRTANYEARKLKREREEERNQRRKRLEDATSNVEMPKLIHSNTTDVSPTAQPPTPASEVAETNDTNFT